MARFIHLSLLLGMFHPTFSDSGIATVDPSGLTFYCEPKSWIDALEHCHKDNFSLVEIYNQTMLDEVKCLLKGKNGGMKDGVWIGMERSIFGCNPPWMWISGLEVGTCPNKTDNFPVDHHNNHCGKIMPDQFELLDAWCHAKLPFICQSQPIDSKHDPT